MNLPLGLELNWAAPVLDAAPGGGNAETVEGLMFAALAQGVFAALAEDTPPALSQETTNMPEEVGPEHDEAVPGETTTLLSWLPVAVAPVNWTPRQAPSPEDSLPAAVVAQPANRSQEVKVQPAPASPASKEGQATTPATIPAAQGLIDLQAVPHESDLPDSRSDVRAPQQLTPGPASPVHSELGTSPQESNRPTASVANSAAKMEVPTTAMPAEPPAEAAAASVPSVEVAQQPEPLRLALRKGGIPTKDSLAQSRAAERVASVLPGEAKESELTTAIRPASAEAESLAERDAEGNSSQKAAPPESAAPAIHPPGENPSPNGGAVETLPPEIAEIRELAPALPETEVAPTRGAAGLVEQNPVELSRLERPVATPATPAAKSTPEPAPPAAPPPAPEPPPVWRRPPAIGQPQVIAIRIPLEGQQRQSSGQQVSLQFSQRMGRLDLAIQAPTMAVQQQLEESLSHLLANLKSEGWTAPGAEPGRLAERPAPTAPVEIAARVLEAQRPGVAATATSEMRGSQPDVSQWTGGFSQERSDTNGGGNADPQGGRRRGRRRDDLWVATIAEQEQQ